MTYRPITDIWLLTRCKYKGGKKRYGGYLGGFPERARGQCQMIVQMIPTTQKAERSIANSPIVSLG